MKYRIAGQPNPDPVTLELRNDVNLDSGIAPGIYANGICLAWFRDDGKLELDVVSSGDRAKVPSLMFDSTGRWEVIR